MKRRWPKGARLTTVLLLVAFLTSLAGCLVSSEDALVGTWEQIDGTEVLQFLETGEVIQEDSGGSVGANYRFVDERRIRVDFGGPATYAPPRTYRVLVTADTLALTDEEDSTKTYLRTERIPTVKTEID